MNLLNSESACFNTSRINKGVFSHSACIVRNVSEFSIPSKYSVLVGFKGGTQELQLENIGRALTQGKQIGYLNVQNRKANIDALIALLTKYVHKEAYLEGKFLHAYILRARFQHVPIIFNLLVDMYGKCKCLGEACKVFDRTRERNVFSWTAVMAAYVQNGHNMDVLSIFEQMQVEGVAVDKIAFIIVLKACSSVAALAEGKLIHVQILRHKFDAEIILGNALINMYGKCGGVCHASNVFSNMVEHDVISWTAMITTYTQNAQGNKAIQLFKEMDLSPDGVVFVGILDACATLAAIAEGKLVHARIICNDLVLNIFIGTALVNMYSKCNYLSEARGIFDSMKERDIVLWNAMIAAYAHRRSSKETLQLFKEMNMEGIQPDHITFMSILDTCGNQTAQNWCLLVQRCIIDLGLESDVVLATALINMHGKSGNLAFAHTIFSKISHPTVVTWTSMIAAHALHGQCQEAFGFLRQMQQRGIRPNSITLISMLYACSNAGLLNEGCYCFISMSSDHGVTPTGEHYGYIIDLVNKKGSLSLAEDLINSLPSVANDVTWRSMLRACKLHGDFERARYVAEILMKLDPGDSSPYILLADTYAAVGRWSDAARIRKLLTDRCLKQPPDQSFIEIENKMYEFVGGDMHVLT